MAVYKEMRMITDIGKSSHQSMASAYIHENRDETADIIMGRSQSQLDPKKAIEDQVNIVEICSDSANLLDRCHVSVKTRPFGGPKLCLPVFCDFKMDDSEE